jgi:formylglycine-generating enzyme required for sulfatase activity
MVLAVFGFLVLCVGFVLVAAPVRIAVEPPVDSISFSGFPPPIKIAERYLVVPGTYRLTAEKEGYRVLEDAIDVTFGSALELQYQMVRLPGLLDVNSIPVSGAEITIDGRVVGDTPLKSVELEAGPHDVRIAKERYLPDSESIEIRGMGDRQAIELSLEPGWATVLFQTEPPGAEVWVDNDLAGTTPAVLEPMGGSHEIELRLTGWKSVSQHLTVEPGETIERPVVVLAKLDGVLELTSVPAGASVTFNEVFRGQTPLTLTVTSEVDHRISLSKEGFATLSESVRVERSETRSLNLRLKQEFGIVFVSAEPPGAQLEVDGKSMGSASRRLTLSTRAHRLKVTKPGYVTFSTTVTPSQSESRTVTVKLKSEAVVKEELLARPTATAAGQLLNRILLRGPTLVRMGASRREAGRRGNESQRSIELTRSFFVSQKEVTNAEFKKFKARHDSGVEAGLDLTEDDQPAASVTWDDAARYLNWLSDKESLPRAYKEDNGKMVAVVPVRTGYRFPTEAEWAFLARYEGGTRSDADRLKYPWGNTLSPPVRSGNYADSSMAGSFSRVIPGYIDDHRVAAPVGSFPPNSSGLYDIGGNVSEWCHDYYDVYSVASPTVAQDPTGPVNGKYHVIRGSSWRHGGITELRFSYRDYSAGSRNDLGFRIARYADK